MSVRILPRWSAVVLATGARAAVTCLLAVLGVVLLAGPTSAHAQLESSDPAPDSVLAQAPRALTLTFSEPVQLAGDGNQLLGAQGRVEAEVRVTDRQLVVTPAEPLADGSWLLAWRVTSADGHPISGGLSFAVGAPGPEQVHNAPDEQRREVQLARVLSSGARYLGFVGAVGLAVFAAVVRTSPRRGVPEELSRRTRTVQGWLLALGILGHVVLVPTTMVWQTGGSWSVLAEDGVWAQDAGGTAVTLALAVAAVGSVVALGRRSRGAAGAALVGVVVAFVLQGHTRTETPTWLVVGADAAHVATAAVWFGGLVGLALVLTSSVAAAEAARVVARFSVAALASVAVLVASGGVLFWRIAGDWALLGSTGYGRVVVAKAALVLVPVLALAWWNRYRLVPAMASHRRPRVLLSRTVGAEIALLVVVLALTGVLTTLSPRLAATADAVSTARSEVQTLSLDLGEGRFARVDAGSVRRGTNEISVELVAGPTGPVRPAGALGLTLTQTADGLGPLPVPLTRGPDGRWTGSVNLPVAGRWTVSLSVPLSEFENPVVRGEVLVP